MTKPRIYFSRDVNGTGLDWIVASGDWRDLKIATGSDPSHALSRFREKYAVETSEDHQKNEVA